MLSFRAEVVVYYELVEVFLDSVGDELWTPIFESEVVEAYLPTGITVINVHEISLELIHSLG